MKYRVLRTLYAGFKQYQVGEEVDLSEDEAKDLLQIGGIEPRSKPFDKAIRKSAPDVQTQDGELRSLLAAVHQAADAVLVKIRKADEEISTLEAERTSLTDAPVSRDDFMAYVRADIERRGAPYKHTLGHWKDKWFKNIFARWEHFEQEGQHQGIPYLNAEVPHSFAEMTPAALYWLFGEQIAERFGEALDALPWPDNAVPVAERRARMATIDAELERLIAYRDELAAELSAVGMTE